jgi:hypothetical protein
MILAPAHVNRFRLADEGASLATGTAVQSMIGETGSQFLAPMQEISSASGFSPKTVARRSVVMRGINAV